MQQNILITVKYPANSDMYHYYNNISFPNETPREVFTRIATRRKQLLESISVEDIEILPKLVKIINNTKRSILLREEYPTKDEVLNIINSADTTNKVKDFYINYITGLTLSTFYKNIEVMESLWIETYLNP